MGPSGPLTLALLVCAFVAAAVVVGRSRRLPLQLATATVAFVAATAFGISLVNAYFDYYQSWGDLAHDVAADNGTAAAVAVLPSPVAMPSLPARHVLGTQVASAPAPSPSPDGGAWQVERVAFPGTISGVTGRSAIVIVPPHVRQRLPVLELLHGEPGGPSSWTGGLRLAQVLRQESAAGRLRPMLVVLPDVRGFHNQQCLDPVQGRHLSTYLRQDVPADIAQLLPAVPAGPQWVVGGLSEGGYCAADLVLHEPALFRGAAIMDGYFHPTVTRSVLRRVFGGAVGRVAGDDPAALVSSWPATRPLPLFWLMAGTANATDYGRAVTLAQELAPREPVRLVTVIGGRHTTPAWRVALPDLLRWASATVEGQSYGGAVALPLRG